MSDRSFQSSFGANDANDRTDWSRLQIERISQNIIQMQKKIDQLSQSKNADFSSQINDLKQCVSQLAKDANCLQQSAQSRPSTSITSEHSLIGSSYASRRAPFFDSRPVFGGNYVSRAERLAGRTPYGLPQRQHNVAPVRVTVNPPRKVIGVSDPLSSSSRRIFEKLEKASTPLQDARRIPHSNLKDYFQTSDLLHRSSKRPKFGPPTHATPVISQTPDKTYQPMRWEMKLVSDPKASKTADEATDQIVNSCDTYLNDFKEFKSNETFGGKMTRRDQKREDRKVKPHSEEEESDSFSLLANIKPLKMPTNLPTFNFPANLAAKSLSTIITRVSDSEDTDSEFEFKFSEPILKGSKRSEREIDDNAKNEFVFSTPLKPFSSAISNNLPNGLESVTKEPPDVPSIGWGDKFKPKAGSWNCSVCCINNDADKTSCVACEEPKLGSTPATKTFSFGFADNKMIESKTVQNQDEKWICGCLYQNASCDNKCNACNKPRNEIADKSVQPSVTAPQSNPLFAFGTPTINSSAVPKSSNTVTNTIPVSSPSLFSFGAENKDSESAKNKTVSFDLSDKTEKSAEATPKKSLTESSILGSLFGKSSEMTPQTFKIINSPNSSIFGSTLSGANPTATTTSITSFTETLQKSNPLKATETTSASFIFGAPATTTSSSISSFSSSFCTKPTPSTTSAPSAEQSADKSIFSFTASSASKPLETILSNQTNPLVTSSSSLPSITTLSSSTSSSMPNGLVFGTSSTALPSFSSPASAATTKSGFTFNLTSNPFAPSATPASLTAPSGFSFGNPQPPTFGAQSTPQMPLQPQKSLTAPSGFSFGDLQQPTSGAQPTPQVALQPQKSLTPPLGFSFGNQQPLTFGAQPTRQMPLQPQKSLTSSSGFSFGNPQPPTSGVQSTPQMALQPQKSTASSGFSFGNLQTPTFGAQSTPQMALQPQKPLTGPLGFSFGNQPPTCGAQPTPQMAIQPQKSSTAPSGFSFGNLQPPTFGAQPTPQMGLQPQQSLTAPQQGFQFNPNFNFNFDPSAMNASGQTGGPFQFSADSSSVATRSIKKAKRRLNPT